MANALVQGASSPHAAPPLQALRALPLGHPAKVWCLSRVLEAVVDWAAACEARDVAAAPCTRAAPPPARRWAAWLPLWRHAAPAPAADAGGGAAPACGAAAPVPTALAEQAAASAWLSWPLAQRGATAVGWLVLELDWPLLPHAFDALDAALEHGRCRLGARGRAALLGPLWALWCRCDDHARKPLLDAWLMGVLRREPESPLGVHLRLM